MRILAKLHKIFGSATVSGVKNLFAPRICCLFVRYNIGKNGERTCFSCTDHSLSEGYVIETCTEA